MAVVIAFVMAMMPRVMVVIAVGRHRVFLVGRLRREHARAAIGRALVHIIILSGGLGEALIGPVVAAGAASAASPARSIMRPMPMRPKGYPRSFTNT